MDKKELSYIVLALIVLGLMVFMGVDMYLNVEVPEHYGELIQIEIDVWENYGYIRFIYEHGVIEEMLKFGTNKISLSDII